MMSDGKFQKSPGGSYKGKKKRKRVMKEFVMDEISSVDRPAQAHATMSIMKRDDSSEIMEKVMLLSSEVDGHQHVINIDMNSLKEGGGDTSYEASGKILEGTDHVDHHSHPWVLNSDGSISIGSNTNHTHEMETTGLVERLRLQAAMSSANKDEEDIEVEVNVYKFAADYALIEDPMNEETWKYPLTKRSGGRADRKLVGEAVHLLKRNKIPSKYIKTVTRKVRNAWIECNPSQTRSKMPAVLKRTFID